MTEFSNISVEPHDDVLHLKIQPNALDEATTREIVDEVYTAAGERPSVLIVLDFGNVRFAPSAAIGAILMLSKSFKLDGRRLAIIGPKRHVRDVIRVTGVDRIIPVHDTLAQVLQSR
jgi:anti-anti-sigma factor